MSMPKICSKCREYKELSAFRLKKEKPVAICRVCEKEAARLYRKNNPDRYRATLKKYEIMHPEMRRKRAESITRWRQREVVKIQQYNAKYRSKAVEKMRAYGKHYYQLNKHDCFARAALRRARKCMAIPKWLTKEQKQEIVEIYRNKPVGYHVDHIVPLGGKDVCGLHVPWNLQYLTALENLKKSNKVVANG